MNRSRNLGAWMLGAVLLAGLGVFPVNHAPLLADDVPEAGQDETTGLMVDALVDELTAGDQAESDAARRQLIQLGPLARPRLEQLSRETNDGRTRHLLATVLQQIDEAVPPTGKIESTTIDYPEQPAPITLHLRSVTAEQAVAALAEQIGMSVRPHQGDNQQTTRWPAVVASIESTDATFTQAANAIGSAFGVSIVGIEGNALTYTRGFNPRNESGTTDLVWARLHALNRRQSINFSQGETPTTDFQVDITAEVDPRVRQARSVVIRIQQAEDNRGNALFDPGRPPVSSTNLAGMRASVSLPLKYPQDDPGDHIRLLGGMVMVQVAAQAQVFTVADATNARNLTADAGGVSYRIDELKPMGTDARTFQLRLSAKNTGMPDDQWDQLFHGALESFRGMFTVTDAQGRVLRERGASTRRIADRLEFSMDLGFFDNQPAALPLTLRMEVPIKTRTVSSSFRYEDLPIP